MGRLTHDSRIRYKPNERAAVIQYRVALLVVIGQASYTHLAQSFVATQRQILEFLDKHKPPFIAKVYRPLATEAAINPHAPGSITLWYPR